MLHFSVFGADMLRWVHDDQVRRRNTVARQRLVREARVGRTRR